mgnify:CR=1 FL=1
MNDNDARINSLERQHEAVLKKLDVIADKLGENTTQVALYIAKHEHTAKSIERMGERLQKVEESNNDQNIRINTLEISANSFSFIKSKATGIIISLMFGILMAGGAAKYFS